MDINLSLLLVALGTALLEISEASTNGIALHNHYGSALLFYAVVGLEIITVMILTALVGNLITYFPLTRATIELEHQDVNIIHKYERTKITDKIDSTYTQVHL